MALSKKISDPTGIDASYWVIANVTIDKLDQAASIQLTGYQDRQTRLDHPAEGIIQRRSVSIMPEDFEQMYEDVVAGDAELYPALYAYVKEHEEDLEGAEDVFDDLQ